MFQKRNTAIHIFIGVLMTVAFILCSCSAECPTRNETLALDLEKFLGEWFVVSATPPNGKILNKCGQFNVTSTSPETLTMTYTGLSRRQESCLTFIVNATLGDDFTGYWQLQGSNRVLGPYRHRVIDVDYESYFAMIACSGDRGDYPVDEFLMIWSRGTTLSSEILDGLKDRAASYIEKNNILDVDQSSCS